MGGQGGGVAVSHDGRRAYVLGMVGPTGWELRELEAPSLRLLRQVPVHQGTGLLGLHRVVAVAPDGQHVYVETMRIIGPTRWDPVLYHGQPDSEYGIVVYDVASGTVTREIKLEPPWCGVAELYALPAGRLAAFCPIPREVRLIDVGQGKQLASVGAGGFAGIAAPDGRLFWVVAENARLFEIDIAKAAVTRKVDLSEGGGVSLPYQELHMSADGKRLFVRAAPHDPELRATGNGSVVWVIDTDTMQRIADVPLPAPAYHLAPTPDGLTLVATTLNLKDRSQDRTRLIEVPSGRELASWPGVISGPRVVASARL
jgi:DNA-binding beta-propeller fold protein YncE